MSDKPSINEALRVFARIGALSFGGPAAQQSGFSSRHVSARTAPAGTHSGRLVRLSLLFALCRTGNAEVA